MQKDITGTMRRLRALAYMGHPPEDVARRIGITADDHHRLIEGTINTVPERLAARTRQVCLDLCFRCLEDSPIRAEAIKRGWYSIAAWNDIDNPQDVPDVGEPEPAPRPASTAPTVMAMTWPERRNSKKRGLKSGFTQKHATDQADKHVIDLYRSGMLIRQIAQRADIPYNFTGVRLLLRHAGVDTTVNTKFPDSIREEATEQAIKLHRSGFSYREIANEVDVHKDVVAKWVRRATRQPQPWEQ